MWISFLYECCLLVLALLSLPKFLYQLMVKGKYRAQFFKRFGSGFPLIKKDGRPLIWVHAVSLGETKAIAPLVKALKAKFNHPLIIFSTTTETGYVESCRSISADHHVYLPFDFGWIINPIIKKTAPDLLILCESDFWYNLLKSAKKAGAKTILVNGKISKKSMERFKQVNFFTKKLFSFIDLFCVQSQLYAKRFEELAIPIEKITVTGNMKFDGDYSKLSEPKLKDWRNELGIDTLDPVLVVGSSHDPEETQLLETLPPVWERFPNLKVLLVPRHPERFHEVAGILQKKNIPYRRLSENKHQDDSASVILVDAMGVLRKCYQLADVAIVAGSFTPKVGGHNILEPSWYGVPVIFGPYMHSQPDLVDLVKEYGAGIQVDTARLADELISCFKEPEKRKSLGEAGMRLTSDLQGATGKTCELIRERF